MEEIKRLSQFFMTYLPLLIPSIGLKVFAAPACEEVSDWITGLWLLFPVLAFVQIVGNLSFTNLIGYIILAKAASILSRKGNTLGISVPSLLVGIGSASLYLYVKGLSLYGDPYPFDIVGVSILVSFTSSTSGVAEIILALSALTMFLPESVFITVYPILLFSSVVVSVRRHFLRILGNEKILFARKVRIITSILTVIIAGLILMIFASSTIGNLIKAVDKDMRTHLKMYKSEIMAVIDERSLRDILKDEHFKSLAFGKGRPSFVDGIYIFSKGKVLSFGKPKKLSDLEKERNTLKVIGNGYEIVVLYKNAIVKYQWYFIYRILLMLMLISGTLIFGFWVNNTTWASTMEREIISKTENLNAANEELSAMNEELLTLNEKLSEVYGDISRLDRSILNFLNFIRSADIRENSDRILDDIYSVISSTLRTAPIGYEIIEPSGMVRRKGKTGEFSLSIYMGGFIMKLFYPHEEVFSEDEKRFFEIISTIGDILIRSHENYKSLEKNNISMSKVLDLLDMILLVNGREKVEEVLLWHMFDLFDDTTTVALGWREDFSEHSFPVKYINKGSNEIEVEYLGERGIMRYVLEKGEEYILGNVFEDDIYVWSNENSRSAVALPLRTESGVMGVIEIDRAKINAFSQNDLKILRIFTRIVAMALQRIKYYEDLKNTLLDTIEALSYAIELKDPYTKGHSRRVANYSMAIARTMGLSRDRLETIEIAALLHDIGKIGIRGSILNKPSRLTKDEYEEITKHPILGEELVKRIKNFKHIAKIIRYHHEFYGGGGYPDGLKGEEIPLESRIISVADAFDAMTSDRPYRKALSIKTALEILEKNEKFQWDPKIVKVAVGVFRKLFSEELEDESNTG